MPRIAGSTGSADDRETIEPVGLRELALRYKVVLLVGLAPALWIVGQWAIVQASPSPMAG